MAGKQARQGHCTERIGNRALSNARHATVQNLAQPVQTRSGGDE